MKLGKPTQCDMLQKIKVVTKLNNTPCAIFEVRALMSFEVDDEIEGPGLMVFEVYDERFYVLKHTREAGRIHSVTILWIENTLLKQHISCISLL